MATPATLDLRAMALSNRLNQRCLCVTLDRKMLADAVARETDPALTFDLVGDRSNLFSNVPVFLSSAAMAEMQGIVESIEVTARLPGYREAVLGWAPESASKDFGPLGAFMGYDFHLDESGPRLIEVNTNAGGAFLNSLLARAQKACCNADARGFIGTKEEDFDDRVLKMFRSEWTLQHGPGEPGRIAIVDDDPGEQYLYPDFILARRLLQKNGIDADIADAGALEYRTGKLMIDGQVIDLVYNRLVDFSLALPEHSALAAAYRDGAVVVTPNPHNYALLAAKRNLTLLSNPAALTSLGLAEDLRARLAGIPKATLVTPENADAMWRDRKNQFFKPLSGYGGKAVYRGDKVTKTVWATIAAGGYIAQILATPGHRVIELDGVPTRRKMDVRLYTYAGQTLLAAARLYQGQTTNFRTPGGGFAPVFVI